MDFASAAVSRPMLVRMTTGLRSSTPTARCSFPSSATRTPSQPGAWLTTSASAPLLLYNIGLAHEELGEFDVAMDYINKYRAFAPLAEQEKLKLKIEELKVKQAAADAEKAAEDKAAEDASEKAEAEKAEQKAAAEKAAAEKAAAEKVAEERARLAREQLGNASERGWLSPANALWGVTALGVVGGTSSSIAVHRQRQMLYNLCAYTDSGNLFCHSDAKQYLNGDWLFFNGRGYQLGTFGCLCWNRVVADPQESLQNSRHCIGL